MNSKIDWENRLIIGKSGTKYKIMSDKISSGRYWKYEQWVKYVLTDTSPKKYFEDMTFVRNGLRKLKTLGDAIDLAIILDRHLQAPAKEIEHDINKYHELCSVFCIKVDKDGNIDEDISEINEDLIREKSRDWGEISQYDFFLLCMRCIPEYAEIWKNASKEINQMGAI